MSKVINIKMVNGVRPKYDIYIGRSLNYPKATFKRSKWANPFTLKNHGKEAIYLYEQYVRKTPSLMKDLPELKDKVLGCWCKPNQCHGDVLIKLEREIAGTKMALFEKILGYECSQCIKLFGHSEERCAFCEEKAYYRDGLIEEAIINEN